MLQIKNTLGGGKPEGLYAWKKCENDVGHTFIDYIVSDKETAYPDGAVHTDGYYYEKVAEGSKVAYGTINGGYADTLTIEHGLGVKPTYVMLIAIPYASPQFATGFYAEGANSIYGMDSSGVYTDAYNYASSNLSTMTVNETKISLPKIYPTSGSYGSNSQYKGPIRWVAVA